MASTPNEKAAAPDERMQVWMSSSKADTIEHAEAPESPNMAQPSQLTWTTKFMVVFALWIGFAGWALQFDTGYTGIVLRMPPFNEAFGHCSPDTMHHGSGSANAMVCKLSATQQSVQSSVYILFMAAGSAVAGVTGNYIGRRRTLQLGSVLIMIGAAGMLGTSGNLVAYIACKCIGGFGIGHLQSAAPTYAVECCPPRKRGLLTTFYSAGSGFGTFLIALVCYGTARISSDWAWKVPILCQIPIAGVYGLGIFMFPESPRWLMTKGKEDEARRSFGRLYSRSPDAVEVTAQIEEVRRAIELERALSATSTWTEMFHRNFIRRTLISVAIVVGAPVCGTFFVFTYAAIFLTTVGISNPFTVVLILNACSFAGSLAGPVCVEYLGRRWAMLTGYAGTGTCMLVFAVVSSAAGASTQAVKETVTAFLCIWAFVFSAFIASSMWVASAEMHALRHRTYAQAFITTLSNIFVFGTNFWTPYMFNSEYGNMGTNVGYFYFGLELIMFVLLYFVLPETGRLSLEQIDNYFASRETARKTSLAKNKILGERATASVEKAGS